MIKKQALSVLAILLTLLASPAFAQKCHLDIDEKDPFSGEIKKMYKHDIVCTKPSYSFWIVQIEQKGTLYSLSISPQVHGRTVVGVAKGTILYLKLEDNTVMEFKVENEAGPTFVYDNTKWDLKFSLTEDQLKKLAGSPISNLKITVNNKEIYCPEPLGKATDKIMRGAACVLQKD